MTASRFRARGRLAAAFLLLLGVAALPSGADPAAPIDPPHRPCPPGAIRINPGTPIQEAVDRAGAGAKFCLGAGVHRLQAVVPQPRQSFFGEPGTVLNGSRLIRDFTPEGRLFVVAGRFPVQEEDGPCFPKERPCKHPPRLFIDDKPLVQVTRKEDLASGTFFADQHAGKVYLLDDPKDRTVEIAFARFAFSGRAANVFITGLVVEKYNNAVQYGAIQGAGAEGWWIDRTEARLNSGAGIVAGSGGKISDCNIHHNGQLGVGATGLAITIEGNRIWSNNIYGFDHDWEAGGVKVVLGRDVVLRGNVVSRNGGPGLWCDIDCSGVIFEKNTVEYNEASGIFFEISSGATIRDNVVRRNGAGPRAWVWGADIQIAASEKVDVSGNDVTVREGSHGIVLVDQGRPNVRGGYYQTRNNTVHDNVLTFDGIGRSGATSDVLPGTPNYGIIQSGANAFDRNRYRYPAGTEPLFLWGAEMNFAGFRRSGQEANGRLEVK